MNDNQQIKLISEIVGKAIETGKIKFEQPPLPAPIIQEVKREEKSSENFSITIFDLLTCIMFTLNLMGVTNINWLLVFLPCVLPYAVIYGIMGCVALWNKFKNRKKKNGEDKVN